MKRLLAAIMVSGLTVLGLGIQTSRAGEIDILLQKLVDKGVLTAGEAQQIGTETKEQVKAEIAAGKYSSLPAWVQNTKLKGDFRLRYQYDHAKRLNSTQNPDTNRGRFRVRLGLESKVNEKLLVGIGFATGLNSGVSLSNKDSSRSPNQTIGEGFAKKPVSFDYALAQYTPVPWATLIGGKMKNPLWEPGDLIWDTDINPEGGAVKFSKKINSKLELFTTTGVFTIDEGGANADPMMYTMQPGFNYQFSDTVSLKGAASFYNFSGVKHKTLDGTVNTNSTETFAPGSSGLQYDFMNIAPALELTLKEPLKAIGVDLPYLAFFGEFVKNVHKEVKKDNTGYMMGVKFGAEKVEKWGDWQVRYNYAMLGKDSILDILPDSDRYGGKTGMRSHELMFDWGLGKNTWFGFDYYYGWQIPGNFGSSQTKPASVLQADWNIKF